MGKEIAILAYLLVGIFLIGVGVSGYGWKKPFQLFSGPKELAKKVKAEERLYVILLGFCILFYGLMTMI